MPSRVFWLNNGIDYLQMLDHSSPLTIIINLALGLLAALYPVCIFFGLHYFDSRFMALILLLLFCARYLLLNMSGQNNQPHTKLLFIAIIAFCLFVAITNSETSLRFYPVIISLFMLVVFTFSLFTKQSAIERLARITDKNLPDEAIPYTRKVTIAWCGFFIINGLISSYTALFSSMELWTLYNGLISYILIGLMFVIEYIVRQFVRKHHQEKNSNA